jgi:hypothetical protein
MGAGDGHMDMMSRQAAIVWPLGEPSPNFCRTTGKTAGRFSSENHFHTVSVFGKNSF